MLIYKATNTVNGNFYIGITARQLDKRIKEHESDSKRRSSCPAFHAAIRKYGESSFFWEIIAENLTLGEAEAEEIRLIATLRPSYNIAAGGNIGTSGPRSRSVICVNDGRKFKSGIDAAKVFGLSQMTVSNLCRNGGKTRSGLRFRFADSEEVIPRAQDPEVIEAGRRSRVEKLKARRHPPEVIERMKVAAKLRGISRATREAADKAKLNIIRCVETGEVFPHAAAVAEAFGLKRSSIYALLCVPGKKCGAGFSFVHEKEAA
jgi:hypothetical protein